MTRRRNERSQEKEPPPVAGRVPPHDLQAEAAVLSACMLEENALDEAMQIIEPKHFYSEPNQYIFEACKRLAADGGPVDIVQVNTWLRDREVSKLVGAPKYLAQLVDATPAVANVAAHARTVREKWRLRRVIAICHRYAGLGYGDVGHEQEFIDQVEQEIYDLAHQSVVESVQHVRDVLATTFKQISEAAERGEKITGLPTHFSDLDKKIAGLHAGDLYIVASRPGMGKTGFVLNVAVNCARGCDIPPAHLQADPTVDTGQVVPPEERRQAGVFIGSMEMPKEQLGTRMICGAAGVDLSKLRQGFLNAEDWQNLTAAGAHISPLPIWIDDTPALSVLDLRARVRRLNAEAARTGGEPVRVVIVDYLQLMTGQGDSREQVISGISRDLKNLAKELQVPVIALSQLNRGVETRGGKDKRPMLSDLRECLAADEWVYTPAGPVRMKDEPTEVNCVTDCGPTHRASAFVPKRYNKVFEVQTDFGRIQATARHLVLTGTGYKQVRDLVPGRDVIASPKRIPHAGRGTVPHARLLGWLLGNGGLTGTPSLIFRKELEEDVRTSVAAFDVMVRPRRRQSSSNVIDAYLSNGTETGSLPNPLMKWIRSLGLEGATARDKHVPERYMGSCNETHIQLLRGLWEADGTVTRGVAKYSTASEQLARQVTWLLLTIGVRSTIGVEEGPLYTVRASVFDAEQMSVVVSGLPSDAIRFGTLRGPSSDRIDPAPAIFVELAVELCPRDVRRLQKRQDGTYKAISKADMRRLIREVPGLQSVAHSPYMQLPNVGWGRLHAVTPVDGESRVADLQVPGPNNFVAGGVVVHNSGSIEQDADAVVFLYRDDYYNRESDDRGTCELIIGKQRNGPTGTVRLRFQASSTRFLTLYGYEEFEFDD